MKLPYAHLAVALIMGVIVVSGYVSWYVAVSQKSRDVAALQDQITAVSGNMSRIAMARTALAEIASDEKEIGDYFVSDSNVVSFINDIESLGTQEGTKVSVTSVSKGGTRALPALLVMLSIDGSFDQVMRTIGAVEYSPYALSLAALNVVHIAAESGKVEHWHADVTLTVDSIPVAPATSTPRL